MPRHLLELARDASAPYPRRLLVDGQIWWLPRPPIEHGQIWPATWDDVRLLVLVTDVEDTEIDAVPVTLGPGAEDAESVVLEPALRRSVLESRYGLFFELLFLFVCSTKSSMKFPRNRWLGDGERLFRDCLHLKVSRLAGSPQPCSILRSLSEPKSKTAWIRATPPYPLQTAWKSTRTLASILGKAVDLNVLVGVLSRKGFSQSDVMSLLRGKRPQSGYG